MVWIDAQQRIVLSLSLVSTRQRDIPHGERQPMATADRHDRAFSIFVSMSGQRSPCHGPDLRHSPRRAEAHRFGHRVGPSAFKRDHLRFGTTFIGDRQRLGEQRGGFDLDLDQSVARRDDRCIRRINLDGGTSVRSHQWQRSPQ